MRDSRPRAWIHGQVFTGDRFAEGVLTEGDRVVAVGTENEIRRVAATGTDWHDLAGDFLLPGLVDPHLHWLAGAVEATGIDLRGAGDFGDLAAHLTKAAAGSVGPLVGGGWDEGRLAERRAPTRDELDAIVPDRPVVLYRVCHHAAVANSAALAAAQIDASVPDPPGGRIERDRRGEPTGRLFDAALRRVRPLWLAAATQDETAARSFLQSLAHRGVTAVGSMSALPGEIEWAADHAPPGGWPVAVRFYLIAEELAAASRIRDHLRSGNLRLAGIKQTLDGSLGARTAWLDAPYADSSETSGLSLCSPETLHGILADAADHRLPIALHAIGDRALRVALEGLHSGPPGIPLARIEHASIVPPSSWELLRSVRPVVVVQPGFVVSDTWLPERLGPERVSWTYPFRQLLDSGLSVAGSSDAPVEPSDPWIGMRAAVDRSGLSPLEAIRLYTSGGARAIGEPDRGTIQPGSRADLVRVHARTLADAIERGGPVREVVQGGVTVVAEDPN